MRRLSPAMGAKLAIVVSTLALAACAAQNAGGPAARQIATSEPTALPAPGGVIRFGDTFATMAQQYVPHEGPYSATGASAWVKPAPLPAFVASGPPPPADPPAPPLAAVANRQPASPSDAAELVRPEAATPNSSPVAAPALDPALRTRAIALFNDYSCGTCHALADANAGGSIGPSLDRNPRLTKDYTVDVIANGRGAMPSFGGQMTDEEIDLLADYIVQFARK